MNFKVKEIKETNKLTETINKSSENEKDSKQLLIDLTDPIK